MIGIVYHMKNMVRVIIIPLIVGKYNKLEDVMIDIESIYILDK